MSPYVEALAVARRLNRLLSALCQEGAPGPVERAWDRVDEALSLLEGDTRLLPKLKEKTGAPVSELIRRAIDQYLATNSKR